MVLGGLDQKAVGHLNYPCGVYEYLLCVKALVVELAEVEGVEGIAAAVEDAPHLVLAEVADGLAGPPLEDVVLDGPEGVLHYNLDLELGGAHVVLAEPVVLYEL